MDQTNPIVTGVDPAAPNADRTVAMIQIPNPAELVKEQGTILARAQALTITNDDEYKAVCAEVGTWAKFKARVEAFFKDDCDRAYKLWQSLTGKRKSILDPVDQAVRIASQKVTEYEQAVAAKAEQERREREAAARKLEEDQKLAEAQALQDAGHAKAAEEVLSEPVNVPVLAPVALTPKVEGKTTQTRYNAEVVSMKELLEHVLKNPEDMNLVEVNASALRKRAEYQRDNFKLPGCKLVKLTSQAWAKK